MDFPADFIYAKHNNNSRLIKYIIIIIINKIYI